MNQEVAQVIALTAHGNGFLSGLDYRAAPDLLSSNSAFQHVSLVTFARYQSREQPQGTQIASGVAGWFEFLRDEKAKRLSYIVFAWKRPDMAEYTAAAFSGGVSRAVQADLLDGFELWYPKWTFADKEWNVEYRALQFPNSHIIRADLAAVKDKLRSAVQRAEEFARRPEVGAIFWADWFAVSLVLLDSSTPRFPAFKDLLPEYGYSLVARQIIAACQQAYVFGGMGYWNDLGFPDERTQSEYDQITKQLYDAVKLGLATATNSFEAGNKLLRLLKR